MSRIARKPLMPGVFWAGFECSEQQLQCGRRLDLVQSTRHEEFAGSDYARLRALGISVCREGVGWVRSERSPGNYDFSSAFNRLGSARRNGVHIVWDLLHFGWPEDIDIYSEAFPARFARYARAFAKQLAIAMDAREFDEHPPMFSPINEISYLAWAGGEAGCLNPFSIGRGAELKTQLVRASIAAMQEIRSVFPDARFLQPEPLIHVVPDSDDEEACARAEAFRLSQFEAWDMLCGRAWPALGGRPEYLDIVGVNFYSQNQFTYSRSTVFRGDARFRPFADMLYEVYQRYDRPMVISETGHEDEARADWLRYVAEQSVAALEAGCPLHAITLYPILNHPGWLDDRHCHNGLWDYADDAGMRAIHEPLARELLLQRPHLERAREPMLELTDLGAPLEATLLKRCEGDA